jgi:hypothetical protein
MFANQRPIEDRNLGSGVAIRGSWFALAAVLAPGAFFLYLGLQLASEASGGTRVDPFYFAFNSLVVMLSVLGAAWVWRTELVIGVVGFRYSRPFRRQQFDWSQVRSIEDEPFGSKLQLVVRLRSDSSHDIQFRLPLLPGLASSTAEITQLMQDRLSARRPVDGNFDEPRNSPLGRAPSLVGQQLLMDAELGECSLVPGSRSWIALAMLGIALLAFVIASIALAPASGKGLPLGQAAMILGGGVFFCAMAIAGKKTRLLIGQKGFRYTRPFRRVQYSWHETGPVRLEADRAC